MNAAPISLLVLGACILALLQGAAAQRPAGDEPAVAVLTTSSARKAQAEAARAILLRDAVAAELGLAGTPQPRLILIHADEATARAAGMAPEKPIQQLHDPDSGAWAYYIWLIGPGEEERIVRAFITALAHQATLRLDEVQAHNVGRRVLLRLEATVPAHSFRKRR